MTDKTTRLLFTGMFIVVGFLYFVLQMMTVLSLADRQPAKTPYETQQTGELGQTVAGCSDKDCGISDVNWSGSVVSYHKDGKLYRAEITPELFGPLGAELSQKGIDVKDGDLTDEKPSVVTVTSYVTSTLALGIVIGYLTCGSMFLLQTRSGIDVNVPLRAQELLQLINWKAPRTNDWTTSWENRRSIKRFIYRADEIENLWSFCRLCLLGLIGSLVIFATIKSDWVGYVSLALVIALGVRYNVFSLRNDTRMNDVADEEPAATALGRFFQNRHQKMRETKGWGSWYWRELLYKSEAATLDCYDKKELVDVLDVDEEQAGVIKGLCDSFEGNVREVKDCAAMVTQV